VLPACGRFRGLEGAAAIAFQTGGGSHQHGLWPCAIAKRPFVRRRSISLPLLKVLDPPLVPAVLALILLVVLILLIQSLVSAVLVVILLVLMLILLI